MRRTVAFLLTLATLYTAAQPEVMKMERTVAGNTLRSASSPAVTLEFSSPLRYAGGQVLDIFNVAGAEQHFFVEAAQDRSVRRFYWVQFEHYYASNKDVYDYTGIDQRPLQLGAITFKEDTEVVANYFTADNRPGSDSEAALKYLQKRGYRVDGTFVRVRMFYLPTADKRKELMLLYGEAVAAGTPPEQIINDARKHATEFIKVGRPANGF